MQLDSALAWLREHHVTARREDDRVLLDSVPSGVRVPVGLTDALSLYPGDVAALVSPLRGETRAPSPSLRVDDTKGTAEWQPRLTNLATVKAERVQWLWEGRIPRGKISVLDGDPGDGKSTLTMDIAARVSIGTPMPDGSLSGLGGPANILLLSAEDGIADTIRPRLDAAGGDPTCVTAVECAVIGDRERSINLDDVTMIRTAIIATGAQFVVIDPLMAYLGNGTNSYRDQDMRAILAPLARLAEETEAAIVVVRHFSKTASAKVLHRGGGSIGIIGAARAGMMVARDPEDPEGPRRILAQTKSNVGAFPSALAFHLEEAANGAAHIIWEGPTHHTAASLGAAPIDAESHSELDEAMNVLRQILADGQIDAQTAKAEAQHAGVSERTLVRAKKALNVVSERDGLGKGAVWRWSLAKEGGQA